MKKLKELFKNIDDEYADMSVEHICYDSRDVTKNSIFFAIKGEKDNGEKYINSAIRNGARFIVEEKSEEGFLKNENHLKIFVKNIYREMAHVASLFFENNLEKIVAVTGTNGKTSTCDIVRQVWEDQKIKSASIGTLGVILKNSSFPLKYHMTTPFAIDLHKILKDLSDKKISNVVLEASSHAIDQHRIGNIKFSVCAFTNFSEDHLDYHHSMEDYFLAKVKLFKNFSDSDTIFVINADDEKSKDILKVAHEKKAKTITYGFKGHDIKILSVSFQDEKQLIEIEFFGVVLKFLLPLVGFFQIYNSLCAAGILKVTGVDTQNIISSFEKLNNISGRLEYITTLHGAKIFIDYAHTPDALEKAISSLKAHQTKRFITVFGCGGEREIEKRHLMGEIACILSDKVIITDDNPRGEDPKIIRKMILDGCDNKAAEIACRKDAIKTALNLVEDGDILLIAGKGHENYQIIKNHVMPFSDKEVILDLIEKIS